MTAAVHARNIVKTYGPIGLPAWGVGSPRSARPAPGLAAALDRVSFNVSQGEIFGVVGPAGSGKTTLIRLLAALLPADSGELRIYGVDVARRRDQVQRLTNPVSVEAGLFKGMSALDNLLNIPGMLQRPGAHAREQVGELLSRLGLDAAAQSLPLEALSRSLQPLVFIARAVLSRPRLLLLDEPFTGLDLFARYRARRVLDEFRCQTGAAVIIATRDRMEAENLADRFALLSAGKLSTVYTPGADVAALWPVAADCRTTAHEELSV